MTAATLALAQLRQRRAWLAREVAERRMPEAEAEAVLLPWLHVACLAAADLPVFTDFHGQALPIPTGPALTPEQRATALRTLGQARDVALDRLDSPRARGSEAEPAQPGHPALDMTIARPAETEQARALVVLATALGAPPYHHPSLMEVEPA